MRARIREIIDFCEHEQPPALRRVPAPLRQRPQRRAVIVISQLDRRSLREPPFQVRDIDSEIGGHENPRKESPAALDGIIQ